jgi:hypothetical protein
MIVRKCFLLIIGILCLATYAIGFDDTTVFDESYPIKDGKLKLDVRVDGGKVKIYRGTSDNDCHVYMEFSNDRCEGDVHFDEERGELEVNLDYDSWNAIKGHDGDGSHHAEITIELPLRPEIDLSAHIKAGEIKFDIGDLHLHNFELKNWAGEVTVDFDEPNRSKLNTFDVNVKVGETKLYNLGNANFEEGEINGGIGEMTIDFSGEKIERTMARIDLDIGETTVIVPENIGTKLRISKFISEVNYPSRFEQRGRYYYSENYRENEKSLYLSISTGIGELRIKTK